MKTFTTGDRVIGIGEYDGNTLVVGVAGTILAEDGDGRYSVEFDEDVGGHDLEGRCRHGFGWHISGRCLDAYKELPPLAPPMTYEEVMG